MTTETSPNIITDCNYDGAIVDAELADRTDGVSDDLAEALTDLRGALHAELTDDGEHRRGVLSTEAIEAAEHTVETLWAAEADGAYERRVERLERTTA